MLDEFPRIEASPGSKVPSLCVKAEFPLICVRTGQFATQTWVLDLGL